MNSVIDFPENLAPAIPVGPDDMALLRQYVSSGCKSSFAQLVDRHIGWVYAMCRRRLKDPHLAEDASQAVFIILARRAKQMPTATRLSGWLFRAARFAVNDARKREMRYRRRQDIAAEVARENMLIAQSDTAVERVDPLLDDALAALSERDRQAILLHYFEGQNLVEMAEILGLSREGAKKRVSRAIDKLRAYFARKRVKMAIPALIALLAIQTQAAPAGLVAATAASVAAGKVPSGMALAIAEGIGQMIRAASTRLVRAMLFAELAAGVVVATAFVFTSAPEKFTAYLADAMMPSTCRSTAQVQNPGTAVPQTALAGHLSTSSNLDPGSALELYQPTPEEPQVDTTRIDFKVLHEALASSASPPAVNLAFDFERTGAEGFSHPLAAGGWAGAPLQPMVLPPIKDWSPAPQFDHPFMAQAPASPDEEIPFISRRAMNPSKDPIAVDHPRQIVPDTDPVKPPSHISGVAPEPASMLLVTAGAVLLLRRRR